MFTTEDTKVKHRNITTIYSINQNRKYLQKQLKCHGKRLGFGRPEGLIKVRVSLSAFIEKLSQKQILKQILKIDLNHNTWTNFSRQDKPWAEFSTLEAAACHAMHKPHSIAIRPNLELKTQPRQLLGSLPLDITLPALLYI